MLYDACQVLKDLFSDKDSAIGEESGVWTKAFGEAVVLTFLASALWLFLASLLFFAGSVPGWHVVQSAILVFLTPLYTGVVLGFTAMFVHIGPLLFGSEGFARTLSAVSYGYIISIGYGVFLSFVKAVVAVFDPSIISIGLEPSTMTTFSPTAIVYLVVALVTSLVSLVHSVVVTVPAPPSYHDLTTGKALVSAVLVPVASLLVVGLIFVFFAVLIGLLVGI